MTANHPEGKAVEIEYLAPAAKPTATYTGAAAAGSAGAVQIQAIYGTPFNIYAQLQVSGGGKELVSITFDETVLALKNSGVAGGKLELTLVPIQHTVTTNVLYVSASPSVKPVVEEYVVTVSE